MSYFWKIKHVDAGNVARLIRSVNPELKNVSLHEMEDRLNETDIEFFVTEKTKVGIVRITLPFAVLLAGIMILFMPINYMINGQWGYKTIWIKNWFKALKF